MNNSLFSLAFGVGTQNRQGTWLEVFYAQPLLRPATGLLAAIAPLLNYQGGNRAIAITTTQAAQLADAIKSLDAVQHALLTRLAESQRPLVVTLLAEDSEPTSTPEAYLKLHLLLPKGGQEQTHIPPCCCPETENCRGEDSLIQCCSFSI